MPADGRDPERPNWGHELHRFSRATAVTAGAAEEAEGVLDMALEISTCRGCGARFNPLRLSCPECGRPLRLVGAALFLGVLLAVHLLLWALHSTIGWPPVYALW